MDIPEESDFPTEDICDHNALAQARLNAADVMMWRGRDDEKTDEEGTTAERSDPETAA